MSNQPKTCRCARTGCLVSIIEMAIGCKFGGRLFREDTVSPRSEECPVHMTQEKSERGNTVMLQLQKLTRKKFFR